MRNTTLSMISLLPSWMKIKRKPDETQGGQFLDVIGGQTQDVFDLLEAALIMKHPARDPFVTNENGDSLLTVAGVDLFNIDFVYRLRLPEIFSKMSSFSVYGDDETLRRSNNVFDFYRPDVGLKYYYDTDDKYLYFRRNFAKVLVNGATFVELEKFHIWGPYDEIGLLIGCPRIPEEKNIDYRVRLLEVFTASGNATKNGLVNYISRSLGLEKEDIDIFEFTDEYVKRVFHENEGVSDELWEFFELSDKINNVVGSSYWEIIDNYNRGIKYLPIYWGGSLDAWDNDEIQSGIGYDDDLLVHAPEQIDTIQDFDYSVGVEGFRLIPNNKYPDIRFKYKIQSKGYKYEEGGISPEPYNFTILSSNELPAEITIVGEKDYLGKDVLDLSSYDDKTANVEVITSAAYQTGLEVDDFAAGEACNPLDTRKMTGTDTYLDLFVQLRNLANDDGTIDYLKAIDIVYTDNLAVKKHIVFTNDDYGPSGYDVVGDTLFFSLSQRTITGSPLAIIKNDESISYISDEDGGGAKVSSAGHVEYFTHKTDWIINDDSNTVGVNFLDAGSITISS